MATVFRNLYEAGVGESLRYCKLDRPRLESARNRRLVLVCGRGLRSSDATPAGRAFRQTRIGEISVFTLLIEDDPDTSAYVAQGLERLGHHVEVAGDGRTGLVRAADACFDCLIVDRMLPGYDGLTIVRTLRTGGIVTPIIFLTAVGGVADRVEGLRAAPTIISSSHSISPSWTLVYRPFHDARHSRRPPC